MLDVIVIGGGPAGLQAALTLGRVHRSVLLLDSGDYRNGTVEHMHNFIGRDGTPPAEFRAIARTELEAYDTVEVREIAASSVEPDGGTFQVASADDEISTSRAVLLATGVRDALSDTPGLDELWGREAANCPFCHGHELAGHTVGILGSGPHAGSFGAMLSPVVSSIIVLADGSDVDADVAERLAGLGIEVRPEPVSELRRTEDGLVARLDGTGDIALAAIFVAPTTSQSAPFADQLGLSMLPSGCIEIDATGHTSMSGVYAAGDLAHVAALPKPLASVLNAAASGQIAATSCVQDLLAADLVPARP